MNKGVVMWSLGSINLGFAVLSVLAFFLCGFSFSLARLCRRNWRPEFGPSLDTAAGTALIFGVLLSVQASPDQNQFSLGYSFLLFAGMTLAFMLLGGGFGIWLCSRRRRFWFPLDRMMAGRFAR